MTKLLSSSQHRYQAAETERTLPLRLRESVTLHRSCVKSELVLMLDTLICISSERCGFLKMNMAGDVSFSYGPTEVMQILYITSNMEAAYPWYEHSYSFKEGASICICAAIQIVSKHAYSAQRKGRAISYSRSLFPGGTCDQMDHTALMDAKRGASWVSVSWHSCSFSQWGGERLRGGDDASEDQAWMGPARCSMACFCRLRASTGGRADLCWSHANGRKRHTSYRLHLHWCMAE